MENGNLLDHFLGEPGYEIRCAVTKVENSCLGLTSATMTNGASDVIEKFDPTSEKLVCVTGESDQISEDLILDTSTGTLAVSSE